MSFYKNSFNGGSGGGGYDSEDDIPFDSQSFTTAKDVEDHEAVIFDRADEGSTGLGSVIRVMNQLYDVVNRLKLEGHTEIKLPQIVVCGSQVSKTCPYKYVLFIKHKLNIFQTLIITIY